MSAMAQARPVEVATTAGSLPSVEFMVMGLNGPPACMYWTSLLRVLHVLVSRRPLPLQFSENVYRRAAILIFVFTLFITPSCIRLEPAGKRIKIRGCKAEITAHLQHTFNKVVVLATGLGHAHTGGQCRHNAPRSFDIPPCSYEIISKKGSRLR